MKYFQIKLMTLAVLISLITCLKIYSADEDWVERYNGPGNGTDIPYSMAVDFSGNVYITGESRGNISSGIDYVNIKYNPSGEQQWVMRYDGPAHGEDFPNSIAVDGLGNVYVTGSSVGVGTSSDFATISYNSSGVVRWIKRYNSSTNESDAARSMAIDGFGNVYVTGTSFITGNGWDYATIKYSSSGIQMWTFAVRYNGSASKNDQAVSIAIDNSSNAYVTGTEEGSGDFSYYTTVKYNSSGVQQWVKKFNGAGNGNDKASAIAVDALSNVYVTGSSLGSGTADYDFATIKYNSNGDILWWDDYNGTQNDDDEAKFIAVDVSGNVYVTGISEGTGTFDDYLTIKYNLSGIQEWESRYNGSLNSYDVPKAQAIDGSGNVYITGYSYDNYRVDYATIKYNAGGVQQWIQSYNGPGNNLDVAFSIALDGSGNVFVTGGSQSSNTIGSEDIATIKYIHTNVGVNPVSSEVPDNFSLSQNYPNPFNPSTKIKFQIKESGIVTLSVFDMLGKEVATIVNEKLKAGSYEETFDGTGLTSGVYFYKLQTDGFIETKRMTLVK
ncbi:MAG: SBBP repeat-containing protein [Bacteroidota bacterium]|nr:SBBP repeat-containing protein [Bacteroidota bacterium]